MAFQKYQVFSVRVLSKSTLTLNTRFLVCRSIPGIVLWYQIAQNLVTFKTMVEVKVC